MKRTIKFLTPLLIIAMLFSSCKSVKPEDSLNQINTYLENNQFNECYTFVSELDKETKNAINDDVCSSVIEKFVELRSKTKIDLGNIYDLSAYNTSFTEKCQKLWNILNEFNINKKAKNYKEIINLRYFTEMINFTKYDELYSMLELANSYDYLDKISVALYEYNSNGNNTFFYNIFKSIKKIDYSSFDPQQYLVTDFRNCNTNLVNAIYDLEDGFKSNDSATVATALNEINTALENILYITDTLSAVNSMQRIIYKKISEENIKATIDSEFDISKREFKAGISFALNEIFNEENTDIDDTSESTTIEDVSKLSKEEAIEILTNAINATKKFKKDLEVTLVKTRNIHLTDFKTASELSDSENLIKSQLNQIIEQSNGKGKTTTNFTKGKNGSQKLNEYIPPSNKEASINPDNVKEFSVIEGSAGYIVSVTLFPELVEKGNDENNIGKIVNQFEFDTSEDVKDFNTSYAETNILVIVNTDGRLFEMEYIIKGVSNCEFGEINGESEYIAQFAFENNYKYEFKY